MVSTRIFVSCITVLLVLYHSYSADAQSGTFEDYEDRESMLSRGLKRASGVIGRVVGDAMSSDRSPIYDMVKNGSTLGINVLSGLVKVDRVREPGQPRGLMVRVFGVPVFNRGLDGSNPLPSDIGSRRRRKPTAKPADRKPVDSGDGEGLGEEEDELPIEPLAR